MRHVKEQLASFNFKSADYPSIILNTITCTMILYYSTYSHNDCFVIITQLTNTAMQSQKRVRPEFFYLMFYRWT